MPNECENTLKITGQDVEVRKIIDDLVLDGYMSCRKVIQNYAFIQSEETISSILYLNEDCTFGYETSSAKESISFMSRWSPPTKVIHFLSKVFVDFEFELTYWEGNEDFVGIYHCKGGEILRDESAPVISRLSLELFGKEFLLEEIKFSA